MRVPAEHPRLCKAASSLSTGSSSARVPGLCETYVYRGHWLAINRPATQSSSSLLLTMDHEHDVNELDYDYSNLDESETNPQPHPVWWYYGLLFDVHICAAMMKKALETGEAGPLARNPNWIDTCKLSEEELLNLGLQDHSHLLGAAMGHLQGLRPPLRNLGLSSLRMVRLSPDSADGTHIIPIAKMLVVEPGNLSLDKCEYLGTRPSDDVISELSRALQERPCWYAGFH